MPLQRPAREGVEEALESGEWAGLSEISDAGALLVRPEGCVASRHAGTAEDAERLPAGALRRILGHR